MAASYAEISRWFDDGVENHKTHLIVVCDTYDYEDYPVYMNEGEDVYLAEKQHSCNMQRVMEIYNLSKDKSMQMAQKRCREY